MAYVFRLWANGQEFTFLLTGNPVLLGSPGFFVERNGQLGFIGSEQQLIVGRILKGAK